MKQNNNMKREKKLLKTKYLKEEDRRMTIILVVAITFFVCIILRILYLNIFMSSFYNMKLSKSTENYIYGESAPRGRILDRNGKIIVDNITTVGLYLVPTQIKDKEKVSTELSKILNVSYEEMYKHVSKKTSIERVHPEGRNLTHEIADKIEALNFDGVYLLKESKRNYPYKEVLSHVIGYTGIDNQGLSGLELKYDKILTGTNGNIKYYSDGKGNRLSMSEIYEEPINGKDVYLTVDLDIQLSLENELKNAYEKYNADGAIGIVMNPNTGEILAMTSMPSFNPEKYQNYNEEIINRNLAIWSNFEPGSTFKNATPKMMRLFF